MLWLSGHVRSMTMSATRYSTAFAHLVSAGASIWALRGVGISDFSVGSFGIFLLNSAVGIVTFGELKPRYPVCFVCNWAELYVIVFRSLWIIIWICYKTCEYDGVNSQHHRNHDILYINVTALTGQSTNHAFYHGNLQREESFF